MPARTDSGVLCVVLVVVLGLASTAFGVNAGGPRHTGLVVSVQAERGILIVEELGPDAVRRTLRVQVPPQARVVRSERNPDAAGVDDTFRDVPIALGDVRRGDFVVVELAEPGRPLTASAVMVTFRASGTATQ